MPNEEDLELECRLTAIEYLIQKLYAAQLAQAPDPLAAYEQMAQQWSAAFSQQSFSGLDPAQSDLIAGELQQQAERILDGVKELLEKHR